jgi:chromate reductase
MKILAFAGSNSSTSINHTLLEVLKKENSDMNIEILDIRNLDVPIYNVDIEKESGAPEALVELVSKIKSFDALIISIPEHNGLPPAFFKNIIDWCSRIDNQFLGNSQTILLSTSPGSKGGANNLAKLEPLFKYWGAEITGKYSVPFFNEVVNKDTLEISEEHKVAFKELLNNFKVLN